MQSLINEKETYPTIMAVRQVMLLTAYRNLPHLSQVCVLSTQIIVILLLAVRNFIVVLGSIYMFLLWLLSLAPLERYAANIPFALNSCLC